MGAGRMKIYLDVFFIVNFFMNLLVFEIMNIFLRKRPVSIRCAAASAEGALAAVLLVFGGVRQMAAAFILMYLIVSCLMIRTAYGKTTVYGFGRRMAGFYLTAVVVAGAVMFLKGIAGIRNIPIIFLLSSAILLLFLAQKIVSSKKHEIRNEQNVFPVTIRYRGKSVKAAGFLDTGNNLYEPVSHECVTIVEYNLFQKMLSEEEKADFNKVLHDMEPELFGKLLLRYIPFHSLGKECDYLPGVRADDMEIQVNGSETVHTGNTWLGICDRFLSADNGYEVLLNSGIFRK